MHWRYHETDFELMAHSGQTLLFDARGEALQHDYDVPEIERLLRDGGYQLEEIGSTSGPPVGRFRGFSNRELFLGLQELQIAHASPSRLRRLLFPEK